MSETFRPKITFWIGKAGQVLLFLAAIFGMIPVVKPMYVLIIAGAVLAFALPQFLNEIREALAIQITISSNEISGRDTKAIFEMRWSDVKAIQRDDNSPKRIFIGTDTDSFSIPLRYFDAQKLWEQIKAYAHPNAFEENAYQTLASFKQRQIESQTVLNQLDRPLVVKYNELLKKIVWICIGIAIIFTLLYFFSWSEQAGMIGMAGLGGFSALVLLALSFGNIEVDNSAITLHSLFGKYKMQWAEVKQVVMTPASDAMALVGENKRLVIPGPAMWSGADKQKFAKLMNAKIELARRVSNRSHKPYFWNSKNVKVRG